MAAPAVPQSSLRHAGRGPGGRVAYAALAALPAEGPLPSDAGLALAAVGSRPSPEPRI